MNNLHKTTRDQHNPPRKVVGLGQQLQYT